MIKLNLLPPERKIYLTGRARNRRVTGIGAMVIVLLILVTVSLFGATLYVGTTVAAQKRRIEQTKQDLERFKGIEQLVLSTRDRVSSLEPQETTRILWSKIAEALAAATPEGVQIAQITISITRAPHLQFSGQADNKERVASLRERLESSDRFENASIRQVGQTQDLTGRVFTTFSLEANLTGVKPPAKETKPKGVGE